MTVKKQTKCSGLAAIISRQRLQNSSQLIDPSSLSKQSLHNFNTSICFNEKDQLQLATKDDGKDNKDKKIETVKIDDIINCVNFETYINCSNTLVFYINRNSIQEAIALKFENEQDFKRMYFTYKYFKMRNRLTKHSNYSSNENLYSKKKTYNDTLKIRKNGIEDKQMKTDFDLYHTTDDDGVTHISIEQKHSRFDQPMSLIGIRSEELGEIDSVIYKNDFPLQTTKKRLLPPKTKTQAPLIPNKDNQKILKGQFVRVNVERMPDVVPREIKVSKIPDILTSKEKSKPTMKNNNVWTNINKGIAGYDSDREEWRSRSQFSTTTFDSLSRPNKMAMAFTLRKPQRIEPPSYYRFAEPIYPRPNNFAQRPPRIPRPMEIKRNQLVPDHRKFTSLQNLEKLEKKPEKKLNISNRISGLTNKLKDLGAFKANSQTDVANLKPVIKNVDGAKRPVVRTCSAEPPKKVTFSAFATVQVV